MHYDNNLRAQGSIVGGGTLNALKDCEAQTKQSPPVYDALERMDNVLDALESRWGTMVNRLSPVYRAELEKPEPGATRPPTSCELEARIQEQTWRAAQVAEDMAAIMEKLCI